MLKDQEKYNRAAVLGWFVLKTTPSLLTSKMTLQNIADLTGKAD